MKNFMEPESVALIGISRKTGPESYNIMENMINCGYSGKIFPVNPNADEILGKKAFSNVTEIGEKIDLAVITTPRDNTVSVIQDCAAAGIKSVIIINQGFSDADNRGRELQEEIVRIAKRNGIRIIGPNTIGIVNNFAGFMASFFSLKKRKTPVGLICQSGIFFVANESLCETVGKAVDLGNTCDIGFYEVLDYFWRDPEIKIIAIHVEGLEQGRKFLDLARKVVKEKPVVVFKTGSSEIGAEASKTHTGTIAGDYQIFKAALKQQGITFLDSGNQIKCAIKVLLNLPSMKGNRIAILTYSGAAGIMAVDVMESYGLILSSLSPETIDRVKALSPDWMPIGNPVDIWPATMTKGVDKVYPRALKAVLDDPEVDGVICISYAYLSEPLKRITEEKTEKPVVAWLYGDKNGEVAAEMEEKARILVYPDIETAVLALSLLKDRQSIIGKK